MPPLIGEKGCNFEWFFHHQQKYISFFHSYTPFRGHLPFIDTLSYLVTNHFFLFYCVASMSRVHHTWLDISSTKSDSPLRKSLVFEDFRSTKRVPLCKWTSTNYGGLRANNDIEQNGPLIGWVKRLRSDVVPDKHLIWR